MMNIMISKEIKRMEIEINKLSKVIKNRIILNDINMSLHSGFIYSFIGMNGSGKTMLMRILCGLVRISDGEILYNHQKVDLFAKLPYKVGAIIEKPEFFENMSAYDNLLLLSKINHQIGSQEIIEAINKVGLNPNDSRKVKMYSLGMKQRLGIAQAIMENPEILILDEPMNALDEEGVQLVYDLLKEQKKLGKLIIISSHNKNDIKILSDQIFYFSNQTVSQYD